MDQFFTQLPVQPQQPNINYNSKLFLIGSCFVQNIGDKLSYHKFQTTINPFGIIFHPSALYHIIQRIINQRLFTEEDIFFLNEQWHCFEVHSELSNSNKEEFLSILNSQLKLSYTKLKEATHIGLTFGTAWSYYNIKNNKSVANCHKVPQKQFKKVLSSASELERSFDNCFQLIKKTNPKAQILTTISPVRHIKDGIVENSRSKANLLAALHQSIESYTNVTYYPAYELVMDSLRDYRFYKADLIHPNQIAIDFIWEHFMKTWIYETTTQQNLKRIAEIQRGLQHRPFNAESEAHKKFIASLQQKILLIKKEFPFLNF